MASRRRLRRRACGKKQAFESFGAAFGAMMRLKAAHGVLSYLTPYRCPFCGRYHFGHLSKRYTRG
jgi:ribosomal protein L37AE/L43A